jgi:hypothetical protein
MRLHTLYLCALALVALLAGALHLAQRPSGGECSRLGPRAADWEREACFTLSSTAQGGTTP